MFIVALLLANAACFCQTSTEEAGAKLRAKQAERDAQRAKMVQVTAGELEDLRAEVQRLKVQNADLQRKFADAAKPGAAIVPKKRPTQVEVGMTRQEVEAFIKTRHDLRIVGVSSDVGVRKQVEETVTKRQALGGSTTLTNGNKLEVQKGEGQEERQTVERQSGKGKQETIVLAHYSSRQVVTSRSRNSLGQMHEEYGTEQFEDGRLKIELTDDVVTSINANQN